MIVNAGRRTAVLLAPDGERVRIRCLARRGMLHSECEAADRVGLGPWTRYALTGRDRTEAAWYVLRGPLTAEPGGTVLHDRDLLLAPRGDGITLRAGPAGAELLCLTVTPPDVTRHLPPRTPDTLEDPSMTATTTPGVRAVHHVAYTVPDLAQAVSFFTDVLGAELAYYEGPFSDDDGDWMHRQLGVHARSTVHLAMLRLGPTLNLELFQYEGPDRRREMPRNNDWGGHHLALWTDDFDASVRHLAATPGVRLLGEPQRVAEGPIEGTRWVYFTTPWGMHLELVHAPHPQPYERDTAVRLFTPAEGGAGR